MGKTEPKRVLIVGCGFPQLGLLRAARDLGLWVLGVDANRSAIGAAGCDDFREVSTHDVDAVVRVAREVRVDGITTCGSELSLRTTVRAAEVLGLPFYGDEATVDRCQAKDRMREAYRAGGAPIPDFAVTTSFGEVETFVTREGFPSFSAFTRLRAAWRFEGGEWLGASRGVRPRGVRRRTRSGRGVRGGRVQRQRVHRRRRDRVQCHRESSRTTPIRRGSRSPNGSPLDSITREAQAIEAALAASRARDSPGPTYTQLRLGPKGATIVETAYDSAEVSTPTLRCSPRGFHCFERSSAWRSEMSSGSGQVPKERLTAAPSGSSWWVVPAGSCASSGSKPRARCPES